MLNCSRFGCAFLCALLLVSVTSNRSTAQSAQSISPQQGYLDAHRNLRRPFALLGGPLVSSVRQTTGAVYVALPDNRLLDSRIFGTPTFPRAYHGAPVMQGVPLASREAFGDVYTQMNVPTPFGDRHVVMTDGRLEMVTVDITATDAELSDDSVKLDASWRDGIGNVYGVRVRTVTPMGTHFPTFGGVFTNHLTHGFTGIGSPLMPTVFAYVGFSGVGEITKNGVVMDGPRPVHGFLTEYARTESYRLGFDQNVSPSRLQFHLVVPPSIEGTPVRTGLMFENGTELGFWHVMFENLAIGSSRTSPELAAMVQAPQIVKMTSTAFTPATIIIRAGETVEWRNTSSVSHTVTADTSLARNPANVLLPPGVAPFNSGRLVPGQAYRAVFTVPGIYRYFCIPHENLGMIGEIVVLE